MFDKGTYVFHETGGVCLIADVCYAPLEGMPTDREYYVLNPVHDRSSVIYVPVNSDRIFLRGLLNAQEARALLAQISTVEVIAETNAKMLRTKYIECMKTHEPLEWVRVMKTVRARARTLSGRAVRLSETERAFAENAGRNLRAELALALGLEESRVETEIVGYIANG